MSKNRSILGDLEKASIIWAEFYFILGGGSGAL